MRPPDPRPAKHGALVGAAALLATLAACLLLAGSGPVVTADSQYPVIDNHGVGNASLNLGAYAGPANVAGVTSFAAVTGAQVTYASDYLPSNTGWNGMDGQGGSLSWLTSAWATSGYTLILGVPVIPTDSSGTPVGTLAGGAAGSYNAYYVTLAKTLVSAGLGGSYLRLGWEFDGTWYAWSVTNATQAANFAAYWRNIVTAMRSVPGAAFKFVWNPAGIQNLSWSVSSAYPGDSYIDFVGFDVYDQSWNSNCFFLGDPNNSVTTAQSTCVFNDILSQPEGLNWLVSFAQAHGKPVGIPEWGLAIRTDGHGLGDDPTFISNMRGWMASNNIAFGSYFNYDTPAMKSAVTDGSFPNALNSLKK
jgi:Glycosyl hydrolase family 26